MKHIHTDLWSISTDEEHFFYVYESREEAVKAVLEDYGGGYVGKCVMVEFEEDDIPYDNTGEYLVDALFEEVGDACNYWDTTAFDDLKLQKMLAKVVIEYINENHLQPNVYKIVAVEAIEAGEQ